MSRVETKVYPSDKELSRFSRKMLLSLFESPGPHEADLLGPF